MEEEAGYYANPMGDVAIRIRDLEEKNRIMKERTILIGKNLIGIRESVTEEMLEVKKELELIAVKYFTKTKIAVIPFGLPFDMDNQIK